ncbi:hypothetical protein D9M69_606140 [compost metagenome]
MRHDLAADIGDDHSATVPLEQIGSEFLFQLADLAAQCRLGDVQAVGGLAEAAQFGDVDEGLELNDVHQRTM